MLKLASPDIRPSDIERAVAVLESGNLVQGPYVSAFENALCAFTSIPACAVVSSGTAALHLALIALGIKHGDVVVVPAFTFPATANVVENIGADVVLCDVDERSYVMTPEGLEATLNRNSGKNITAVIMVHEFGYPAEIEAIAQITGNYGLKLIEDAACALGTCANGHHPGYYSDVACVSFHPRKAITTGDGGALLSTDRTLVERIKVLRNHGIVYDNGAMDFVAAGLNYRMTDFQAALALGQLERFHDELRRRVYLAELYFSQLGGCPHLSLPQNVVGHSWQSFMIVLDNHLDRNMMIELMRGRDVQVNLGAQALNCLTFFRDKYGVTDIDCPSATKLFRSGLVLPLYGSLADEDIEFVCTSLKELISA
jgi:perosamine synthetase